MKLAACLFAGVCLMAAKAHAAPMSQVERQRLVAHLEMTASWIDDETSHLSRAQLEFRSSPDKWSVIDVLEHLNLAEPIYWRELRDAVKQEPSSAKSQITDADALWYGIDRTERQKTSPDKVPKSNSDDVKARLDAFRKLHAEMIEYARTTSDDLRAHVLKQEGSDAYQWLLVISTHVQRHILQIREIKADHGFPRN